MTTKAGKSPVTLLARWDAGKSALKAVGIGKQLRIARTLRSAEHIDMEPTGLADAVKVRKPNRAMSQRDAQHVTV